MAAARPQPIPVFAEMSSINPVLVLPQALKVAGRENRHRPGRFRGVGRGQFCTNPGLVLGIRSPAFSAFLERFTGLMGEQPPQTMLNAGALNSYGQGLQRSRPSRHHPLGRPGQQGNQAQPQVFKADAGLLIEGDELLQEEVFGPTTVVVEVADHAELVRAVLACAVN